MEGFFNIHKSTNVIHHINKLKNKDFPGGTVVKNPPANAGDMGSISSSGRSHMPRSNKPHVPQLLSLRSRARMPQLLKPEHLEPALHNKRSHCNEKPTHSNGEQPPLAATRERSRAATQPKDQMQPKKKKKTN